MFVLKGTVSVNSSDLPFVEWHNRFTTISFKPLFDKGFRTKRIIYILEWNLLEKSVKRPILLYCFYTAGVLYIFRLYNLLGPGISFYRKSKIKVKIKPNYEIDWFPN